MNVLADGVPRLIPDALHAVSAACSCVAAVEVVGTMLVPARRNVPEPGVEQRFRFRCSPGGAGHRRDIRQRGEGRIAEHGVGEWERVGGY